MPKYCVWKDVGGLQRCGADEQNWNGNANVKECEMKEPSGEMSRKQANRFRGNWNVRWTRAAQDKWETRRISGGIKRLREKELQRLYLEHLEEVC